jgi:hypothetical protein
MWHQSAKRSTTPAPELLKTTKFSCKETILWGKQMGSSRMALDLHSEKCPLQITAGTRAILTEVLRRFPQYLDHATIDLFQILSSLSTDL